MMPSSVRCFADAAEYQAVDQERWYTPQSPVSGRTVVFDADANTEKSFAPWPVKEQTIRTTFGVVLVHMIDFALPLGPGYGAAQMFLCLSYSYNVYNLMTNAVTKVVLLESGKQAEFTFGKVGGKTVTVNIKDIVKGENEKVLVETYEESTMFPLKVGNKTYYLHGQGQECVKNGELLRAIINGQSIKS